MEEANKTIKDCRLACGKTMYIRHEEDGSVPSDIGWSDLDISNKPSEVYGITVEVWQSSFLCFGDYDNSCDVERANVEVMREIVAECKCTHCIEISGSYGSEGLLFLTSCDCEEVIDTLEGLEDYPAIDDEACSRKAMELQDEAWAEFYCKDFTDELRKTLGIELDNEDKDEVRELFETVRERENCYWEIESGGTAYVDVGRITKAVTIHDVVKFFQETEWHFEDCGICDADLLLGMKEDFIGSYINVDGESHRIAAIGRCIYRGTETPCLICNALLCCGEKEEDYWSTWMRCVLIPDADTRIIPESHELESIVAFGRELNAWEVQSASK